MYLTDEAVQATLNVMGAFPAGSVLVMDFVSSNYTTANSTEVTAVDNLRNMVSGMREPFLSEYMPDELVARLKQAGFLKAEVPTVGEFAHQYLGGDLERLEMHPNAQYLAVARV